MSYMEEVVEAIQNAQKDGSFYTLTQPLTAEERAKIGPLLAKNFAAYLNGLEKGTVNTFNSTSVASTFSGEHPSVYVERLTKALATAPALDAVALGREIRHFGTGILDFSDADMARIISALPKNVRKIQLLQAREGDIPVLSSTLKDSECAELSLCFDPRDKARVAEKGSLKKEDYAGFVFALKAGKVKSLSVIAPGQGVSHPLFGKNVWSAGNGSKNAFNRANKRLASMFQALHARSDFDGNSGRLDFLRDSDVKKVTPMLDVIKKEMKSRKTQKGKGTKDWKLLRETMEISKESRLAMKRLKEQSRVGAGLVAQQIQKTIS